MLVKCNVWSEAFCGEEIWRLRKVDQKYVEKLWNVMHEEAGEDQLDWSFEKIKKYYNSQGGNEYTAYNKKNGVRLTWLYTSFLRTTF